jgi:hypothetical protein
MASSIDRTSTHTPRLAEAALAGPIHKDIPGLASDRIGQLYAEEERRMRVARTDRLISRALTQLQ